MQSQGSLVTLFRNLVYLGGARLEAGDRAGALAAFDRADRLVPAQNLEPVYHLYLGYAYLQAGQPGRAAAVAARLARAVDTTRLRDRAALRTLERLIAGTGATRRRRSRRSRRTPTPSSAMSRVKLG